MTLKEQTRRLLVDMDEHKGCHQEGCPECARLREEAYSLETEMLSVIAEFKQIVREMFP